MYEKARDQGSILFTEDELIGSRSVLDMPWTEESSDLCLLRGGRVWFGLVRGVV